MSIRTHPTQLGRADILATLFLAMSVSIVLGPPVLRLCLPLPSDHSSLGSHSLTAGLAVQTKTSTPHTP